MQGGWGPPPGGGGYGPPGGGGGYGAPPPGGAPPGQPPPGAPPGYGQPPPGAGGYAPQNPYGQQQGAPQMGQMGGMPGMGMPMGAQFGTYEFNDFENSIIDKSAGRAKLWGIISCVIGGLQILGSCGMVSNPQYATYLPSGIIAIVVGITFIGVGNSLKSVVQTQGNDMMHMMQAVQKLGSAFLIQAIAYIIYAVVVALLIVLLMFVFVAVAASR
jgi:hypothetical protein